MPIDINAWRERIGSFNFTLKIDSCCTLPNLFLEFFVTYMILINFFLLFFLLLFSDLIIHYSTYFSFCTSTTVDMLIFLFFILKQFLLLLSGDIELNPGDKHHSNLKVCYWNLNSLQAHNFAKVSSLRAYNTLHKFDIICLSETYLDSSISSNDPELLLDGYELIRADHPMNLKRGGVCIY